MKPSAAPFTWPYPHRTMADVMAQEHDHEAIERYNARHRKWQAAKRERLRKSDG